MKGDSRQYNDRNQNAERVNHAPAPSTKERERYEKMLEERERKLSKGGNTSINREVRRELERNSEERKRVQEKRREQEEARGKNDKISFDRTIKILVLLLIVAVVFLIAKSCVHTVKKNKKENAVATQKAEATNAAKQNSETDESEADDEDTRPQYTVADFTATDSTVYLTDAVTYQGSLGSDTIYNILTLTPLETAAAPCGEGEDPTENQGVVSTNIILVDLDTNEIIVDRQADEVINPASMTKIMTVLVAMDYITEEQLDDTVTISQEICDYVYLNDCSAVGYQPGQVATVRDLLYGTILPSGADAAIALAEYVAGSQEAFVELMNERLEEFGLSDTAHFTNCTGIYDENHHCTVKDMAVILSCAMQNETLQEVLNARTYQIPADDICPDGILLSNWFLRRIEDKETNGEVIGAKTGFVNESGNCSASCMETAAGKRYVCVTANAYSSWRCIYDHVSLYRSFTE